MPELPDVSAFGKYFNETSAHHKIERVEVYEKRILRGTNEKELNSILHGRSFHNTQRFGKHLFAGVNKETGLDIHFGMTGELEFVEDLSKVPPYTRLLFVFKDGTGLAFEDPRKFGHISVVHDLKDLISKNHLGKDALSISEKDFLKIIKGKRAAIKTILMNQFLIAGIGNVYADEILFQAGIHPKSSVNKIPEDVIHRLYQAIKQVLKTAVKYDAQTKDFPSTYLLTNRKKNVTCPGQCGEISVTKVNGRTSYFCDACQHLY